MIYIKMNATFCDSTDSQEECYTLCGKSNIRPELVTTSSFAYPITADTILCRDPQYTHVPYIPAEVMSNITFPNNGWAWIYKGSQPNITLYEPCYNDILALNDSNSISTMEKLIHCIAEKRYLDAQVKAFQKSLEAQLCGDPIPTINSIDVICKLPDSIKIYAKCNVKNVWHHLFILGKFTNDYTSVLHFITSPFNQPTQSRALSDFQLSHKGNILTFIAETIKNFQNKYNTKVILTKFSPSDNLVVQPVS